MLNGGIVYRKFKSKKTISNYKPPKKELGVYEKYEINHMKEFNRAKESGQLWIKLQSTTETCLIIKQTEWQDDSKLLLELT